MSELRKSWKHGASSRDIDLRSPSISVSHDLYEKVVASSREKAKKEGRRLILMDGTVEDYSE